MARSFPSTAVPLGMVLFLLLFVGCGGSTSESENRTASTISEPSEPEPEPTPEPATFLQVRDNVEEFKGRSVIWTAKPVDPGRIYSWKDEEGNFSIVNMFVLNGDVEYTPDSEGATLFQVTGVIDGEIELVVGGNHMMVPSLVEVTIAAASEEGP